MTDPEKKEVLIECGDGKTRKVTVDTRTRLISNSVVVDPVHTSELSERQKHGLGLPEGYEGQLLGEESDRTYGVGWPE